MLTYMNMVCKQSRTTGKGRCITAVFWTGLQVVPCLRGWKMKRSVEEGHPIARSAFYHQKKVLPFLSTVSTLGDLVIKTEVVEKEDPPSSWTCSTYLV